MQTKIRAIRRGGSGEEVDVKVGVGGGLNVSQYLPSEATLTALGCGWQICNPTAKGCVVVKPSIAALLTLWNGEQGGGKSYIISRIYAHQLAGATTSSFALWACVHVATTTLDGDLTNAYFASTRGIATYGGNAKVDIDETVADDGWFPWTASVPGTVDDGPTVVADVFGRMIIPPQCSISLHVVGQTGSYIVGFHWYEVQLDLG